MNSSAQNQCRPADSPFVFTSAGHLAIKHDHSLLQASPPADSQKQQQHHPSKSTAHSAPSRSQLPPRQASQPPLRDPAVAAQLAAVAEARGKQAEGRGKGKKPVPGRLPDASREGSHVPPSFQTSGAYVAPGWQPDLMQQYSTCVHEDHSWHAGPELVILSATAQGCRSGICYL